jgi:cytochrome P450
MAEFFRALIARRRAEPTGDLLCELIDAREGEDRLTDDELVSMCILMLFAGHETTTNHIANGLHSLMRWPDQMAALREDPALVPDAVEELLRYDGPSGALVRVAARDHEVHGRRVAAGDRLFLMLHSANRDPRAYPDPDRLDLRRDGVPHLTFGFGLHICLGFPLARTEGQVSFPAVLARWRSIEPVGPEPRWLESLVFRGMSSLPVRVRRA